jgi:hypothetical protein
MIDATWSTTILLVVQAIAIWVIRAGSKKDAKDSKVGVAQQVTSRDIQETVDRLEADMALVKKVVLKDALIDHRGGGPAKKGTENA